MSTYVIEKIAAVETLQGSLDDFLDTFHASIAFEILNGSDDDEGIAPGLRVTNTREDSNFTYWVTKGSKNGGDTVLHLPPSYAEILPGEGSLSAVQSNTTRGCYVSFVVALGPLWVDVTDEKTYKALVAAYPQPVLPTKVAALGLARPFAMTLFFVVGAYNPSSGSGAIIRPTAFTALGTAEDGANGGTISALNSLAYVNLGEHKKVVDTSEVFFGLDQPFMRAMGSLGEDTSMLFGGHVDGPASKSRGPGFWSAEGTPCLPHVRTVVGRPENDNHEMLCKVEVTNQIDD